MESSLKFIRILIYTLHKYMRITWTHRRTPDLDEQMFQQLLFSTPVFNYLYYKKKY